MFKKLALSLVVFGSVMHIFCCGLPLLLSLTSLAAMLGISGAKMMEVSWFVGSMQGTILMISGLVLAASFATQWLGNRIDCHTDGHCTHEPCDTKKSISNWILIGAACLYVINILIFFATS